jgi:hypothetical protein
MDAHPHTCFKPWMEECKKKIERGGGEEKEEEMIRKCVPVAS